LNIPEAVEGTAFRTDDGAYETTVHMFIKAIARNNFILAGIRKYYCVQIRPK